MIRIRQIEVPVQKDDIGYIKKMASIKLNIKSEEIKKIIITKQSLDARKKPKLKYIYEVDVEVANENEILNKVSSNNILKTPDEKYTFEKTGTKKLENKIVIVGTGPAGLFSGYLLAELGYNPLIIERGKPVEERIEDVNNFWKTGILNKESNVQFGEGGAGTFSDGKLNTLVKDKRNIGKKVFEIFIENGAPKEIMYVNNPHIGTDLLIEVVKNIRNKIIKMGGTFRYNTCLTDLIIEDNKLKQIEVNNKEIIDCNNIVLAIGHSARDTFEMLEKRNLKLSPKPFAIGVRIEHPQKMINQSQYGVDELVNLPVASYKLTYKAKDNRGVYSFCMCPGGYVVNASSEENRLAINGMSNHARNSLNANSALVVTITPDDFGHNPLDGIEYQRKLEALAFQKGNGKIPIQLLKDFKENKPTTTLKQVEPIFKGSYEYSNINEILPEYICKDIKEAIIEFDKRIKGYGRDDAILAAIESRTSSPVRIERTELYESNIAGIYPIGEGAGYAGGITTSAMDGIKVAEIIASTYKN